MNKRFYLCLKTMAKKHTTKKNEITNIQENEKEENKKSISKIANYKIEESLKDFSKLSEKERKESFGDKEFFDQFREYFKKEHPNLLDEIDSQEKLTIYVQNIEEKWFSLENLTKNKDLQKELKETKNEKDSITEWLKNLREYCNDPKNKMPSNIFEDFAKEIDLKTSPVIEITSTTKITKIWKLLPAWKRFLENKSISLKDYQKTESEKLLELKYLPTERLLISATIKKIKKNLPSSLLADFNATFSLPIDINSPFETLENLKRERDLFVDAHRSEIDENLEKKLNKIIISNGDIYKELEYEGEDIEWTKGFSEQTKNFRRIFNKLVTRQVYEEAKENKSYIESQLTEIGKEFKQFPPYFNQLFAIYPYKHKNVIEGQITFKNEYNDKEKFLQEKENILSQPKPESEKEKTAEQRRNEIHQEILKIKEELNTIKRKAYAAYIETKNPWLGTTVNTLIDHKFDMNAINKSDQQKIVNILVEKKLNDSIENQIPNVLWIDAIEYKTFVKNLFDLNQKDIVIPTQYGNIPLHFLEKNFLGWPLQEGMEIDSSGNIITEKQNLPLNFKIQITEQNKDFFEKNIIFWDLFSEFISKKWPILLNDSYKVSIKNKEGRTIEWYLSEYPPSEDIQEEIDSNKLEKWRYLYSHPITRPEDARSIKTRDEEGKNPVVIAKSNESEYEIDIISRELNLNNEAIWWLLFANTLWQYNIKNDLDPTQEKKLATKFWKIEKEKLYRDTYDMATNKEEKEQEETKEKTDEELKEKDYQEFLEERKTLQGYQEKEWSEQFKNGSRLLIQTVESNFQPTGAFMYMNAEVKNIDKEKWTFQIIYTGNEMELWPYEKKTETHKLTKQSLKRFKERFEENKIYKLPNKETTNNINEILPVLENITIDNISPSDSFKETHRDGSNFTIDIGKNQWEKVTHFWLVETVPWEDQNQDSKVWYMYQITHDPAKKLFTLTANDKEKTKIHLDYPNFILFVASRKLQPKTEETAKSIEIPESKWPLLEQPKKWKWYSIASVLWLVKNFTKKIGDWLKKYEEEQVEELTESVFYQGKLFWKLANIMPTHKLKEAFWNAADEYMAERDNKTWKKIEKYLKFYEGDPDFGWDYMWWENIKPFLEKKKKFKDNHQAAAMLLATIKKGKGPYSRNTDRAGKGMRVRILFGEWHQKRYLMMKEKLQRELDQWYNVYGQIWADDLQNEILKLEMKYITHCIDGRQLRIWTPWIDDTPQLEAMYSKKFAGELEGEANKFFSESVSNSSKEKWYSFELARFEYFRLLGDRPQQAIPCLKQIAAKAVTPTQWKVFESAVLTGMLSGVFYNITQEDKSFIQKICRTIGFLPGMRIRDPNHHQKVEQFIKIATGDEKIIGFEKKDDKIDYNSDLFWFWKGKNLDQFKKVAGYDNGINLRLSSKWRLKQISDFWAMSGKNYKGRTIIELINDPTTPKQDRQLLSEIEARSLEKDESVDADIKMNGYSLEQNILAKNQSLIDEITDFNDGKFKGKDKDEIQWIQTARKKIAKEIPTNQLEDKNQVIYLLKKFFNRFEGRWFNTEEKRFLIRTLLTIKQEINQGNKESADEMLWYIIVGNIVKNSGNGQAPDELIKGLEAFKEFFKANLDTILEKDIISQWFENSLLVEEVDKWPYKVAPWDEYVDLEENKMFFWSSDENKKRSKNKKLYNTEQIYINRKLYTTARQIEQRNHIPNKFKNHFDIQKQKSTSDKLHETLKQNDIRIKNHEIREKIKRKLSGQLWQDDMTDEDMAAAMNAEDWYNDFY